MQLLLIKLIDYLKNFVFIYKICVIQEKEKERKFSKFII